MRQIGTIQYSVLYTHLCCKHRPTLPVLYFGSLDLFTMEPWSIPETFCERQWKADQRAFGNARAHRCDTFANGECRGRSAVPTCYFSLLVVFEGIDEGTTQGGSEVGHDTQGR